MDKEDYTFFGEKKVDFKTKTLLVDKVFSNVAGKYDLMNDLMSLGIHRLWKEVFCMLLDNPNARLLDVAGGTGDISSKFYRFAKSQSIQPEITICDINIDMLDTGREKLINKGVIGIDYVNANAESLPFPDNSFDYYSVAFGIRNFSDINASLREAKRVLKKGGKFCCLEFSKPQNTMLDTAYNIYSKFVIPNLGSLLGDRDSYQYLIESIQKFPSQNIFAKMISDAGFENIYYRNLSGGIVAIHCGIS